MVKGRRTKSVPENEGEIIILLALFGELEKGGLSSFRVHEIYDERVDVVLVVGNGQAGAHSMGKGVRIADELRNWRMGSWMCDSGWCF